MTMFLHKNPILLGEAPKGKGGHAFDWDAWTTKRFADAIGFDPKNIHKFFRPKNLLNEIQPTGPNRFDDFDHELAVSRVGEVLSEDSRVICVGNRVTKAVAEYFGFRSRDVKQFIPWCKWGELCDNFLLAQIPHPANNVGRESHKKGLPAQPGDAIKFLIAAIRERYPDAFSHIQE